MTMTRLLARSIALLVLLHGSTTEAQPVPRYGTTLRGDLVFVGNTMAQDCSVGVPAPVVGTVGACGSGSADRGVDVYWRSDSPASGQAAASTAVAGSDARSSAILTLPPGAVVVQAYLYWAATILTGTPADTIVTLSRPGVFSNDVGSIGCGTTLSSYQCVADITTTVTEFGPGVMRVSGVDSQNFQNLSQNGTFAAWSLAVVYALPTLPMRHIAIADGLQNVTVGVPAVVPMSGFVVPPAGASGQLWTVAYGGETNLVGDSLLVGSSALADAANPADNFFNSSNSRLGAASSTFGDLPQLTGEAGSFGQFDIDLADITSRLSAGATAVEVLAQTTGDAFDLGVVGVSVNTVTPELVGVMTVTDVDGGAVQPGDVVRISVAVTNTGNDAAIDTQLRVALVPEVTFVPGTLEVIAGANVGSKTDADGDDQAAYVATSARVDFNLGSTADGDGGGILGVGETTSVTFDVVVSARVGDHVELQGLMIAAGQSGAQLFSNATDDDGVPPLAEPVFFDVLGCMSSAECSGEAPVCDTDNNVCVGCLGDLDCSGETPICDADTLACRGCAANLECGADAPVCSLTGACEQCTPENTTFCPPGLPACDEAPNRCVECIGDGDCGGTRPYCDIFTNVCVSCATDLDCSGSRAFCGIGGVCRGCESPGDCSRGDATVCDPSGLCVECNEFITWSCGGDTPLCNVDTRDCVECLGPDDCGGTTPVCMIFGSCAPCASDTDCGTGLCLPTGACSDCVDGHQPSCPATCGDGVRVDVVEACDDGNDAAFDGCSTTCQVEDGYSCIDLTGWLSQCSAACGDGQVAVGAESCDDANTDPDDGCNGCVTSDGFVCAGEPSTCSPAWLCGDGVVDSGEACDDGNGDDGDGCDAGCAEESGHVCAGSPSECAADSDGDRVADVDDVCPEVSDDQADGDRDGYGDACDACPEEAAPGSVDGCVVSVGDDEPGFDTGGEDVGADTGADSDSDTDDGTGVDADTETGADAATADAPDAVDDPDDGGAGETSTGSDGSGAGPDTAVPDADADTSSDDDDARGGGGGGGGCTAAGRVPADSVGAALVGLALMLSRRRRDWRTSVDGSIASLTGEMERSRRGRRSR